MLWMKGSSATEKKPLWEPGIPPIIDKNRGAGVHSKRWSRLRIGARNLKSVDKSRLRSEVQVNGTVARGMCPRIDFAHDDVVPAGVILTGSTPEETARLERSLRSLRARLRGAYLKSGKTYSLDRLQKATSFLRARLAQNNYLAAQVKLISSGYHPNTNLADISFNIEQGPQVFVKVTGARISGRTRKRQIPIYEENAVDSDLVQEGAQNLASYFQNKGFFDVEVRSRMEQQSSGVTILYEIEKGPRGKVKAVKLQGNKHFSDRELRSLVDVKQARELFFSRGKFSSRLVARSATNIESLYRNSGYSKASVTPEITRDDGNVRVVFKVHEGARNIVASLVLEGNKSISEAKLAPKGLNLEPGEPYSQERLRNDRDQIMATYLKEGFLTASFRSEVRPEEKDPHQVEVTYEITEGPQIYTAVVEPLGAPHTDPRLIVRTANIKAGRPLLVTGALSSSVLQMQTRAGRIDVRNLSAPFELAGGNFEMSNIRAQVLGGNLFASLTVRDLASVPQAKLKTHLQDASLERLEAAPNKYALHEAYPRGRVSADADATWGRTLGDLVARADATLEGTVGQNQSAPLSGRVHAAYSAARQEVEVRQSYLRTPATSLTLNGKVSPYSQLKIDAHSSNLHELELLASNFMSASSEEPIPKLGLHGSASFSGFITGLVTEPQLQGKLEARNLRARGSSWRLLRVNVDADPSALSLSSGYLEAANQGKINFSVRTGFDDWIYTAASPIELEISASQVPIAELQSLANNTYPVSGTLSGNASVHGSQLNPVGYGFFTLTGGEIFSEPIESLTLAFQGDGNLVDASSQVQLPAGSAHAQMTLDPKTQQYQVRLRADNVRLENLEAVKRHNLSLVGALSLDAAGEGTLRSPELMATVRLSQLRFQEQAIPALTATVGIRERVAEIELNSETAQAAIGHGTVEMKPPYMADLNLDTTRFSLGPLLAFYAPAEAGKLGGEAEVHAFLRGPLQNKTRMEGRIDIPVLTANYQQFHLGAAKPVRVDYVNDVLMLHPVAFHGTGTDVQMQATIPVKAPSTATYLVHGTMDLGVARILQPDLKAGGQVQIDLDSRRHVAGSDLIGEARIVNATVHAADVPLGLDNGNGVLSVSPNRLEVKSFEGQVGGGTIAARGEATFRPAIHFDFGLTGKNIRLRYPEGVRTAFDTNLTLAGNQQDSTLAGNVNVERLSLTRDFDVTGLVTKPAGNVGSPPPTGLAQHVRLNVEVKSGPQVNAVSTKVSVRGNANLQVVGTAAEPVILGRADLNGGDFFLGGNRYVLQSGAIDFVNPFGAVLLAYVPTRPLHAQS